MKTQCMKTQWYQDPALYEYLSSDTFWVLGIAIVAHFYWTSTRYNFEWLRPHITSRIRQILAITIYSVVLLLQLLEGSWILKTVWRLTVATLKGTYPRMKPYILGFILYSPVTAFILAVWWGVLLMGMLLVVSQFQCVLQLSELQLNPTPSDESEKKSDGGEWDEVEKT